MMWFVVLLIVAGAGFYFYQKLTAIEREIRAEQQAEISRASGVVAEEPKVVVVQKAVAVEPPGIVVEAREPTVAETPVPDEFSSLEEEILAAVKNMPGIQQAELYISFSDVDKKKFQRTIKKLSENGDLQRDKQGSSYALTLG